MLARCPNGCFENIPTHFLVERLNFLHECFRFKVLGRVTACHVLFLGIAQTSPPTPWPPFCTNSFGQSRTRFGRVKSGVTQPKKKEKVLRRVAGDSASPADGGNGRQPRALARPLSKIQSNPCMATPPQLCNLTHRKVLGYKHTTSLFPCMSLFFFAISHVKNIETHHRTFQSVCIIL